MFYFWYLGFLLVLFEIFYYWIVTILNLEYSQCKRVWGSCLECPNKCLYLCWTTGQRSEFWRERQIFLILVPLFLTEDKNNLWLKWFSKCLYVVGYHLFFYKWNRKKWLLLKPIKNPFLTFLSFLLLPVNFLCVFIINSK